MDEEERVTRRVLVVTVWADADGLHRVVSRAALDELDNDEPRPLRRQRVASDAAVLDLVREWLSSISSEVERTLRLVESCPTDQ